MGKIKKMLRLIHNPSAIPYKRTLTMHPRKDLSIPDYWKMLSDIQKKFHHSPNGGPMDIRGGTGFAFDIPPKAPDKWIDRVFIWLPPWHSGFVVLKAAPGNGYQIKIAVVSYTVEELYASRGLYGFTAYRERYKQDLPLEFFIKIADVMEKYKIFLDTSDADVVDSAF